MNAATLEREKQDVDNPTLMVHLAADDACTVARCGAKLRGIYLGPTWSGEGLDCHVCAETLR